MPEWRAEIEGASIVLLGHFNPKIFQPSWFDHHGLIRAEEAESAENSVSLPELTTFTTAWLSIQVTPDRFQATTIDPAHFEALRDLVLGTFALLEHTPFDKMGMNREMDFKVLPEERYVELGHFLVPKVPWRGVLTDPRTRSVTVQGFQTRGSEQIQLFVKVEPSVRIPFGVFILGCSSIRMNTMNSRERGQGNVSCWRYVIIGVRRRPLRNTSPNIFWTSPTDHEDCG